MRGLTNSLVWLTAALAALPSTLATPLKARSIKDCDGVRKFELTLTWEKYNADGVEREQILVNKQFPGPTLEMNQGDKVEIVVHNKMNLNTTVHFHGIEMLNTVWSDGVPGVTQKHIPGGGSFIYQWEATQYGSYWYHSHQLGQMEDGLIGAIIIHPKKDQLKPWSHISADEEVQEVLELAASHPRPLILSDWRHKSSQYMIDLSHAANMELPCFDSILFNGKGSVNCKTPEELAALYTPGQKNILALNNGTSFTAKGCLPPQFVSKTISPAFTPNLEVIPEDVLDVCTPTTGFKEVMKVNKRDGAAETWIAIDLIGAFSLIQSVFSIDEVPVWVYAVDGEYIVPQLVHAITINNGDRYSVLVKLTEGGEFPMRVASIQNTQIMSASATLKYGTDAPRTTIPYIKENGVGNNGTIFYNEKAQLQLEPKAVSPTADATHKLFFRVTGPSYEWALNSSIFPAATMDHGSEGVVLFEPEFDAQDNHTITTLKDQWVDLILITATTPMPPHPIHKHGNKMWRIGSGVGPFPWANVAEAMAAVPQNFNLASPPHRDTFMTQLATPVNATWTVLRYHASQPGPWLLHCHVQSHLVGGMSVIIQDGKDAWPEVPEAYLEY